MNSTKHQPKRPYTAPKVAEVGTVVERTLGQDVGASLDASFPVGTPSDQLTFS